MAQPCPEVAIRLITASNTGYLERIDDDVFDNPLQPALLQSFLASPANLLAVAVCEGEVIGMASGISYAHPDKPLQLFINEVGVSGRFHRHGVGTRLVHALLDRGRELGCTEAWVATEVGNVAARGLYTSAGGTEDAEQAVIYVFKLATERPSPQVIDDA